MKRLLSAKSVDRWIHHAWSRIAAPMHDQFHSQWVQWNLRRPYPLQQIEESIGDYGERLVSVYLERCGYKILEQSFNTRVGEIDLIAVWQRRQIVFVEVKTWSRNWLNAGGPSDAVDDDKQTKMTRTALIYLKRHGLLETPARFDVVEVTFDETTRKPIFRHFENAFEATGQFQFYS